MASASQLTVPHLAYSINLPPHPTHAITHLTHTYHFSLATPQASAPMLHLREQRATGWAYSSELTREYLDVLGSIGSDGLSLRNKV